MWSTSALLLVGMKTNFGKTSSIKICTQTDSECTTPRHSLQLPILDVSSGNYL